MAIKKLTKHVCSECLNEFDAKELFIAHVPNPEDVPNRDYNTIYCTKCIEKLKIEEFKPFGKIRKVRVVKEKIVKEKTIKETVKKPTVKKPTVKKSTVKKSTVKKPTVKKPTVKKPVTKK